MLQDHVIRRARQGDNLATWVKWPHCGSSQKYFWVWHRMWNTDRLSGKLIKVLKNLCRDFTFQNNTETTMVTSQSFKNFPKFSMNHNILFDIYFLKKPKVFFLPTTTPHPANLTPVTLESSIVTCIMRRCSTHNYNAACLSCPPSLLTLIVPLVLIITESGVRISPVELIPMRRTPSNDKNDVPNFNGSLVCWLARPFSLRKLMRLRQ